MSFWLGHDSAGKTESGIHIENVHQDAPEFRRVYSAKLDERASIKVTIKTFMGERFKEGELTQPNGRWVLFEVERPADKILDPTLVPLVQKYVDEILELDRVFIKSAPHEFIDEHGSKWVRQ